MDPLHTVPLPLGPVPGPGDGLSSVVIADSETQRPNSPSAEPKEDYHWLHGKLWMGDQPFTGQLLVTRFEPRTGVTKGYSLEATANESAQPSKETSSDELVVCCDAQVKPSKMHVFQVGNGLGSGNSTLTRIPTVESWPPITIPANGRKNSPEDANQIRNGDYSQQHFRLDGPLQSSNTFAAIDPELFTPNAQHPYRGLWMGQYEVEYEFLLFHQDENRLQVIKLTGDRHVPRGSCSIIVENLSHVKSLCTDVRWQHAPVVAAKIQAAEEGFVDSRFIDAELVLVSGSEVILRVDHFVLQLKRVSLEPLLWETAPEFTECCLCPKPVIKLASRAPSTAMSAHGQVATEGELPSSAVSANPPDKWAVLIGIDHYKPGNTVRLDTKGKAVKYPNLSGCVEDILSVERYLLGAMGVQESHIKKLLAPLPTSADGLSLTAGDQPTYKNIVRALESISTYAKLGDLVYIHYSGYGARATTIFPHVRKTNSWDRALVPSDIESGGKHLRDLELAVLLERMVDAGLVVTVVRDCSYHGDGVRGSGRGCQARGIAQVYQSALSADFPEHMQEIEKRVTRDWLQQPRNFALFAACLDDQVAREDLFDGRCHGVLTYWLLNTLRHSPSSAASSEMLYRRVRARAQSEYADQVPSLVGNSDGLFFNGNIVPGFDGLTVRGVKSRPEASQLELSGGSVHGVQVGSVYAILPFGCDIRDAAKAGNVLGRVVVTEVLQHTSSSSFIGSNEGRQPEIVEGCACVLVNLPFEEKCYVKLSSTDTAVAKAFRADWETQKGNNYWLQLLTDDGNGFRGSVYIFIDEMGHYKIEDGSGQPLQNISALLRPLSATGDDSVPRLIAILQHLAQFRAIEGLENLNATSSLLGRISIRATSLTGEVLKKVDGAYEVAEEQAFHLQLKNQSDVKLTFATFDIEPELLSVSAHSAGSVDPGQTCKIRMRTIIPEELNRGAPVVDLMKVFVSPSETLFKFSELALGTLSEVEKRGFRAGNGARGRLQQLLEKLGWSRGRAGCVESGTADWQILQLQIRTFPGKPERTIVEDAEFLGLGGQRKATLSTFESPCDTTAGRLPDEKSALHNLCDCCNNYFGQAPLTRDPSAILLPPPSQFRLHESLEGVSRSAEGGCHFCSLILYNLDKAGMLPDEKEEQNLAGIYLLYSCSQGRGRERVRLRHTQGKPLPLECPTIYVSLQPTAEALDTFIKPGEVPQGYLKFCGATSDENESHPSTIPHKAQTSLETSSPEHMGLARNWLKKCAAQHPACNKYAKDFVPTRLLYVGERWEGSSLRLCLTQNNNKRRRYCCLSHCWGGVTGIPLLKNDTLPAFLVGIDIATLPRSFQDAILITRQLGVRFLWIDSLCIIQDSSDDWAKEAGLMGKVYENGYCTIAAAEASNSHEGCFVRRNPLNCNPVRVASLPDCELLLEPPRGQYFGSLDDRLSSYVIWLSNLPSRGWVFQEALLSRKILYFGRGLFWTCGEGQASELDPLGGGMVPQGIKYGGTADAIFHPGDSVPRGTVEQNPASNIFGMFFRGQPSGGNAPGRHEYDSIRELITTNTTTTLDYQFHQYWMNLLSTYTGLNLTVKKDRLPALSGIVQNIMRLVRWKYYAGLWEPTLHFDLIWTISQDPKPRPEEYTAPSWSWASINGTVGTNLTNMDESIRANMEVLIKVLSVTTDCHPADVTSTGRVLDGELVVEGMLFEYYVTGRNWVENLLLTDDKGRHAGELRPDIEPSGISERVFVLPVLRAQENSFSWSLVKLEIHGLALVERGGHFERVAYYNFTSSPVRLSSTEDSPQIADLSSKEETIDYSTHTDLIRTIRIR